MGNGGEIWESGAGREKGWVMRGGGFDFGENVFLKQGWGSVGSFCHFLNERGGDIRGHSGTTGDASELKKCDFA
jgi:hypothetical protein